jgi:hypothetical protein
MSNSRLIVHSLLQDSILIYSKGSKYIEDMSIHRSNPISDEGDDNPLPSRSTVFCGLSPELGPIRQLATENDSLRFGIADISDVEHYIVQCPSVEMFIFVVCHQLCLERKQAVAYSS